MGVTQLEQQTGGPLLPRKATGLKRSRQGLESLAYQVGMLVAIQRYRKKLTQAELGASVGVDQWDVSQVENGAPAKISNDSFDRMFAKVGIGAGSIQANFLKWWRDNG